MMLKQHKEAPTFKRTAPPRKPLNGYNLYLKIERERILAGTDGLQLPVTHSDLCRVRSQHGRTKRLHRKTQGSKYAFHELNREISQRWKRVPKDQKKIFQLHALQEKRDYIRNFKAWKKQERQERRMTQILVEEELANGTGIISNETSKASSIVSDRTALQVLGTSNQNHHESNAPHPPPVPGHVWIRTLSTFESTGGMIEKNLERKEELQTALSRERSEDTFAPSHSFMKVSPPPSPSLNAVDAVCQFRTAEEQQYGHGHGHVDERNYARHWEEDPEPSSYHEGMRHEEFSNCLDGCFGTNYADAAHIQETTSSLRRKPQKMESSESITVPRFDLMTSECDRAVLYRPLDAEEMDDLFD